MRKKFVRVIRQEFLQCSHIISFWILIPFLILFIPCHSLGLTQVSGPINSDTTWTVANSPYHVVDTVTVALGAKLTIEPGTVVKFEKGRSPSSAKSTQLIIQGALWAQGTASNKIYFTSIDDPTVGGITGDGTPNSNDWGWIEFQALSKNASSLLEYCVLRYGGYDYNSYVDSYVLRISDSSPVIRNCEFSQCRGGVSGAGTTAQTISNNVFSGIATVGIYLASGVPGTIQGNEISGSSSALQFTGNNVVTVTGNTLKNNALGVYWGAGCSGTFTGNTLTDNTQACRVDADFSVSASGNQVTGSGFRGLTVFGTINADTTWSSSRLTAMGLQPVYHVMDTVTVALGAKLTIEPGTVVKFEKGRSPSSAKSTQLIIQGALWAQGTASNKIYFTSIDDPTVGGITGDGTPNSNDWGWIEFQALSKNASSLLEYCVLRYGGYDYNSYVDSYVLRISDSSPVIRNCEFSQCRGGVYVNNGSADISRSSFRSIATTGIYYELGSASDLNPVVMGNTFDGVPTSIRYAGGSSSSYGTIAGNEFLNATTAILVNRVGTGLSAYNNQFGNITSFGIQNTDTTGNIDAQFNWWGAADGPSGTGSGTGVKVSQYVTYNNWWTSPEQNTQGLRNVRASRQGTTMLVDILYDLVGVSGTKYCVTVSVSNTGGEPYTIIPSPASLSGAVGCGLSSGNDLHILWDAAADGGGNYTNRMRVKITANIQ